MDDKDLYWLAGLLEGEGSFFKPPPCEPNRPRISLEMTDEDTIQRVNALFDLNYYMKNGNEDHPAWKPSFRIVFRGKRAVEMMRLLYPLMGSRRQKQIEAAIDEKPDQPCDASNKYWFFWLVGLLEGEGSFQKSPPSKLNQPQIQLNMTDHEVVVRAAAFMGVKPSRPYEQHRLEVEYKPRSFAILQGKRAVELMKQLYPYMSSRRQTQIDNIIASYQPVGQVRGERHPQSKLTETQVREIKRRLKNGEMLTRLASEYAVDKGLIWQIKAKRLWQHID